MNSRGEVVLDLNEASETTKCGMHPLFRPCLEQTELKKNQVVRERKLIEEQQALASPKALLLRPRGVAEAL